MDNKAVIALGSGVRFSGSFGLDCEKYVHMLCLYCSVQPLFMAAYEGVPGSSVRLLHLYSESSSTVPFSLPSSTCNQLAPVHLPNTQGTIDILPVTPSRSGVCQFHSARAVDRVSCRVFFSWARASFIFWEPALFISQSSGDTKVYRRGSVSRPYGRSATKGV